MATEPVWVVQTNLGSAADVDRIRDACFELGFPFVPVKAIPFSDDLPDVPAEPRTVFYGSSNLTTKVHRARRWTPGVYFDEQEFRFSTALRKLGEHLLNADAQIQTMASLANECRPEDELLFIRPDGDLKEFAGATQTFGEFRNWCELLRPGGFTISLATSVVVSTPKPIDHEWRLFMVGDLVVTGSHYRASGSLAVSSDVPNDVLQFGADMARIWQPAPAFVLDVAFADGKLKVIEINGINSSGFYASDVRAIVKAVSAMSS